MDEWIKKMWYMYIVEIVFSHKEKWNKVICRKIELEIIILSEKAILRKICTTFFLLYVKSKRKKRTWK
jgi:ABC-type iron transport system FetAB permease component